MVDTWKSKKDNDLSEVRERWIRKTLLLGLESEYTLLIQTICRVELSVFFI